ncbi:hypothetical protein DRO97_04200 [Archaeoglobales archaeon]|nr:MAG: hypothetical protein DRO97_04200 [Archaeoglobales archaeon]
MRCICSREECKKEWDGFQLWVSGKLDIYGATPHERIYNRIILTSGDLEEAEARLLEYQEDYDVPAVSAFYQLYDLYCKRTGKCGCYK